MWQDHVTCGVACDNEAVTCGFTVPRSLLRANQINVQAAAIAPAALLLGFVVGRLRALLAWALDEPQASRRMEGGGGGRGAEERGRDRQTDRPTDRQTDR